MASKKNAEPDKEVGALQPSPFSGSEMVFSEYSHLGAAGEVKPKSKEAEKRRQKALSKLATKKKKQTIHTADEALIPTTPIPTGLGTFDEASGIGGIGLGIIVEFFGCEGVGKSYAAQKVIAQAQRLFPERYCLYVDSECGLDNKRMRQIGIDTSQLDQIDFEHAEDLLEQLEELIPQEIYSVIVIDSLATLVTKAEVEGELTDQQPALLARVLSKALKQLLPLCRAHQTTIIFINQLREKIGTQSFQKVEDTPGGRACKHAMGQRVDFRRYYGDQPFQIKSHDGTVIGQRVSVKFVKNRCAPPLKEGMFELYFAEPDLISEVVRKAKKAKLWRNSKGRSIYVSRDGLEYSESNEGEAFIDMLIFNDLVYEMAERIIEMQRTGQTKETLLPDTFSLEKLRMILNNENADGTVPEIDEEEVEMPEDIQ